jgi:tetratricopeptide (TPR) repeat protein
MIGYLRQGIMSWFTGRNREALESLEHAARYDDPVRQRPLSYRFGVDPGLDVLCWTAHALFSLGLPDRAARVRERVLSELATHGHAQTVATLTATTAVGPEFMFGDIGVAGRLSAELIAYCTEKKVEHFRLVAQIFQLSARALTEPTEENIAALRAAIDARRQSGASPMLSPELSRLAEASLRAGDVGAADASLQEAFAFVDQSGERFWLAELHRLVGQVAQKRQEPNRARAEACFFKAIDIARGQEARMLELRAATDLARLWRDTGSPNDPRSLLEPILAAIEGGETTRDVRNARAVLAEVA